MEKLGKRVKRFKLLLEAFKKGSSFLEKLKRVKRFKLLGEAKKKGQAS